MLQYLFYLIVAATVVVALANWRAALYVCLVLDVLRDPVRKVTEGHPVWITQSVNLVWIAIAAAVLVTERKRVAMLLRQYPQLRTALVLLCLALLPGAVMSLTGFGAGWKLALLGSASYLALIPGVLVGYCFARNQRDISRLMTVYCLANAVMLVGGLFEYFKWRVPGLGGIDVYWLRYRTGYTVDLISGFYRSPDIMGLHAANVCMFASILGATRRKGTRLGWWALVAWAALLLFLCGRRKMIGIPFVFGASFVFLQMRYVRKVSRADWYMLAATAGIALAFLFAHDVGFSPHYATYGSTLATEGIERARGSVFGSPLGTFRQTGVFGLGLGTATQGAYHFVGKSLTWQEDGVGRLVVELGLIGAAFFAIAAILVVRRCHAALKMAAGRIPVLRLQTGLLSLVIANLASFVISHQAYSGDPSSVCIVLLCVGIVLFLPARRPTLLPINLPARAVRQSARRFCCG